MSAGPYRYPDDDPLFQRLAGAFLISLLFHTSLFGVLQLGNQLRWWDSQPFSMFRKVRVTPEEIARLKEEQRRLEELRREQEPMIFVQVTTPADEPPPDSRFYSSQSSRAANPEPGDASQPRIDGRQTQSVRTTDAPQIATGRSTPAPPPEPSSSQENRPEPVRSSPPQPVAIAQPAAPKVLEKPAEPQRPPGIGDLALVQPVVRPEPVPAPPVAPRPSPATPATPAAETRPAPQPTARSAPEGEPTPPPRSRPRTVTEAKLRQNLLAGEKMKQEGGVPRTGPVSLDVKGTGFGAYDEALIMAVQNRWFALLDERRFAGGATGKVVVKFKLHSDGSVRIVEPTESSVDPLLTSLCVRAIRDPSPYEKWPSDMLRMIGSNFREVRFTFYYN